MPSTRLSEAEVVDQLKVVFANPASIGQNQLLAAPGVGFKYVVYGYSVNATGGATVFYFTRGAGTPISSQKGLVAQGGTNMPPGDKALHECNENETLGIVLSAATGVGVDLWYAIQRVTP